MLESSRFSKGLFAAILMGCLPLGACGDQNTADKGDQNTADKGDQNTADNMTTEGPGRVLASDDATGNRAPEEDLVGGGRILACGLLSAKEIGEVLGGAVEIESKSGWPDNRQNPYGHGYSTGCYWGNQNINNRSGNSQSPAKSFGIGVTFWEDAPPEGPPSAIPSAEEFLDTSFQQISSSNPGAASDGRLKKLSGLGDGALQFDNQIAVRSGDFIIHFSFSDASFSAAVQERLLPIALSRFGEGVKQVSEEKDSQN